MTDKPSYKIIATPGLVTIRFRDGTELKMSPQYAGKLAVGVDLAAISAEKKGRKKYEVASKWNYVPPRQLTPRPDMDEANDKLAAARSDEIRKGWDQRMQEAEALSHHRTEALSYDTEAPLAVGYDPASGPDETVITERTRENEIRVIHDSVDGTVPMRKRIQDISGIGTKRDLTDLWPSAEALGMKVDIDLKKAETDAMENAIAADCPLIGE